MLLLAVLVAARIGGMAARETYEGPGPLAQNADLVVPPGGTRQATAALAGAGAIQYPWAFEAAVWLTRKQGPIRAGEFLVPAHASLADLLAILRHGAPVEHQVTIPEGLTGVQIAAILNAAAEASGQVDPPSDGAVLPQTYDYLRGTARAAILHRAERAMRDELTALWAKRDSNVKLETPEDAVTLASIVQAETPIPSEMPEIAAVYENRLAQGMKLQADPTVIYAATNGQEIGGTSITRGELGTPSPYNTYINAGLPPGPICAPGLAALQAVLHPADTQALYFVATGHGGHVFATTFKQQLKNIAAYRKHKKDQGAALDPPGPEAPDPR